jgi:hypothetical protein
MLQNEGFNYDLELSNNLKSQCKIFVPFSALSSPSKSDYTDLGTFTGLISSKATSMEQTRVYLVLTPRVSLPTIQKLQSKKDSQKITKDYTRRAVNLKSSGRNQCEV